MLLYSAIARVDNVSKCLQPLKAVNVQYAIWNAGRVYQTQTIFINWKLTQFHSAVTPYSLLKLAHNIFCLSPCYPASSGLEKEISFFPPMELAN